MKGKQADDYKPMIVIEQDRPTSNAFYVLGLTTQVLRDSGKAAKAKQYMDEAVKGDYEALLTVTRKYVYLILV